jgi:hypothetical protein
LPVEVATEVLIIDEVAETPLVLAVKTLAAEPSVFDVTALEVAVTPFTILEIVLPDVESKLVVDEAMTLASEVVAVTPFTVELRTTPLVDRAFELMIEVELATPLTVEVMVLALLNTPFDEMTELVAATPLILVVSVLPERL